MYEHHHLQPQPTCVCYALLGKLSQVGIWVGFGPGCQIGGMQTIHTAQSHTGTGQLNGPFRCECLQSSTTRGSVPML
jgi:hypothetical protein